LSVTARCDGPVALLAVHDHVDAFVGEAHPVKDGFGVV
jgi:hypothetical protein